MLKFKECNWAQAKNYSWLVGLQGLFGVFLVLFGAFHPGFAQQKRCLYVSSYHQGYAWSDGVERGLRKALGNACELRQFNMDTKRKKSLEDKESAAKEAHQIIQQWQPNVVITSDDNAAKFLILPYYKNADTPFVFNGINWSIKEYDLPFSNTTGIVEVAPIEPMLKRAASITGGRTALYLGADTLTEKKNFSRVKNASDKLGFKLDAKLAPTMQEWMQAYKSADEYDFIIVGSDSGIDDWDKQTVVDTVSKAQDRLTVTNHLWMMPYTMLGYTKIAEEHGEWAGKAAVAILNGTKPNQIPITTNRKWDLWVNDKLIEQSDIVIDRSLLKKAKKY